MEPLLPLPDNIKALSAASPKSRGRESFAYFTVKDRLPVIITKAIDTLTRNLYAEPSDNDAAVTKKRNAEAKECISQLSKLSYEMQRNRILEPLQDNQEEMQLWNFLINHLEPEKNAWFSAPWLFIECYLYRKIQEIFNLTTYWKGYDVFAEKQKEPAFFGSTKSIVELSNYVAAIEAIDLTVEKKKSRLEEFIQFSLWGNQTDLSLLINATHTDMHKMQNTSAAHLADAEKNIIVNDIHDVVEKLISIERGRVDFVLDNAGFELFADLCLADWLIHCGIAQTIVFHGKAFPWFVSDTTSRDFNWTLEQAEKEARSQNAENLLSLLERWKKLLAEGTWSFRADPFWTMPYSFWQLPTAGKAVYDDLCKAQFLFFKGDLNYRKIVYDAEWPTTTTLREAIGPLAARPTPPFALLRTCKSDVAIGLRAGQEEELDRLDAQWMVNGKYGMIQYWRGE